MACTVWVGASWSVADVSLSCSKIGVSGTGFGCDAPVVQALGMWPLVGTGLMLAAPPSVAALLSRRWVSWLAVAVLVGLAYAGLENWASTSYWRMLFFAVPLACIGAIAAYHEPSRRRAVA